MIAAEPIAAITTSQSLDNRCDNDGRDCSDHIEISLDLLLEEYVKSLRRKSKTSKIKYLNAAKQV